ncbi:MAG: hypothetical protein HOV94_03800 [Saccharothrix sp.]|nr:hypothetical protein [Saccharothrix sp.]
MTGDAVGSATREGAPRFRVARRESAADLEDVLARVARVLGRGVVVQLLAERRATADLLRASLDGHRARLGRLFDGVVIHATSTRTDPDVALAWIAFSYACEYTGLLAGHRGPTGEPHLSELRERALDTVLAQRGDLLRELSLNPGVLYAGTDKWVRPTRPGEAGLFRSTVVGGRGTPSAALLADRPAELIKLRQRLAEAAFEEVDEAAWVRLRDGRGSLLRLDTSGAGFDLGGVEVVAVEGLLHPRLPRKAPTAGRVLLADGTAHLEASGHFVDDTLARRRYFTGDLVEHDTTGDARRWREADWRVDKGADRATCYAEIHPKIAQYLLSLVPPDRAELAVLDVGGGDGDADDVGTARERFAVLAEDHGFAQTRAVVGDPARHGHDAAAVLAAFGLDPVDVLVASGGPPDADAAGVYAELLRPGGHAIYAGLTPLAVNSATHTGHGLEIRNLYDAEVEHQLHVVRRPR